MRLGGPIHETVNDPASWVAAHHKLGYSAAIWPLGDDDPRESDYVRAALAGDLVLAEIGAWSNPISVDPAKAKAAIEKCCSKLATADRAGVMTCVNIAGSRGPVWDGPHPDNVSADTFDLIVQVVRQIIDTVRPTRAFYALETMPWVLPDSPDSYLDLIKAIDRKQFAVHLDPVNMISSPRRAYATGAFLKECFEKLGPYIKSCHGKDVKFTHHLTVHLDECRPGTGVLDYGVFLKELSKLHPDTPLVLEHLPNADEYAAAATHVRDVAKREGLSFK